MSDPIQATSSIPLPAYQTLRGAHDPLPVTGAKAIEQNATARAEQDRSEEGAAFKDYLDQTSITVVEKDRQQRRDAADLIAQTSIYLQPGTAVPL